MKIVKQSENFIFYNLTIEDKNGVSSMFITQYTPTEYWLNNKEEDFKGSIISARLNNLTQYTDPEIIFD